MVQSRMETIISLATKMLEHGAFRNTQVVGNVADSRVLKAVLGEVPHRAINNPGTFNFSTGAGPINGAGPRICRWCCGHRRRHDHGSPLDRRSGVGRARKYYKLVRFPSSMLRRFAAGVMTHSHFLA